MPCGEQTWALRLLGNFARNSVKEKTKIGSGRELRTEKRVAHSRGEKRLIPTEAAHQVWSMRSADIEPQFKLRAGTLQASILQFMGAIHAEEWHIGSCLQLSAKAPIRIWCET